MKDFKYQNVNILLGQNSKENQQLIISCTNSNYVWLHLNSFPSGHILIECENVDNEILQYAGKICLSHTKYKNQINIKCCYTPISNVILTEKKGEVEFKSNRKVKYLIVK